MLVRDHHQPRAAAEDLRQFRGVEHALDRAVDDYRRFAKGGDHGREPVDRAGRAGGAHRNRRVLRRRHEAHVERADPEPLKRQFGEMHVEAARLGFREDGRTVAGGQPARPEDRAEGLDPLALDAIREHGFPAFVATPGNPGPGHRIV